MDPVLQVIDEALAAKSLTDAAASQLAVGHPSLLKNMRAGAGRHTFEALKKLAPVLGLECYFGPPRDELVAPSGEFSEAPAVFEMREPDPSGWSPCAAPPPEAPFAVRPAFRHPLERS